MPITASVLGLMVFASPAFTSPFSQNQRREWAAINLVTSDGPRIDIGLPKARRAVTPASRNLCISSPSLLFGMPWSVALAWA